MPHAAWRRRASSVYELEAVAASQWSTSSTSAGVGTDGRSTTSQSAFASSAIPAPSASSGARQGGGADSSGCCSSQARQGTRRRDRTCSSKAEDESEAIVHPSERVEI